jgi:hypothetical protein
MNLLTDLYLYFNKALLSALMPSTSQRKQVHFVPAAAEVAADIANVNHNRLCIEGRSNECIEYCPQVLNAVTLDKLTSGWRSTGPPLGVLNTPKFPAPAVKVFVAIGNSHTESVKKLVEKGNRLPGDQLVGK